MDLYRSFVWWVELPHAFRAGIHTALARWRFRRPATAACWNQQPGRPWLPCAEARAACHPTSSIGKPERRTIRAASGSTHLLYSAAGVTFPSQQGFPPITTHRLTLCAAPINFRKVRLDLRSVLPPRIPRFHALARMSRCP